LSAEAAPGGHARRWGLALLALHALLLFFPPIPPVLNGSSVPLYALSLAVAGFLAAAVARRAGAILAWWGRAGAGPRALAAILPLAALALAFLFRAAAMERYARFQREEGVFETLTLAAYLAGAILLWRASAAAPAGERKPWRLLAALYVWLALEEVDYFSLFGGMIGRIRGEYAGSLHDVIRLTALGIMGARAWAVLAAVALVAILLLWRRGYLAPRWILARAADPRLAWAAAGLAFLAAALTEEAHFFGWTFAVPTPEEPVELTGAIYLAVYALEEAAGPAFYRPD
jgi:hypothetical protein